MANIDIEWIHLHLALSKANRRAYEAEYVYGLLDEALKYELGRPFKGGRLLTERPADRDMDRYQEVQVWERAEAGSQPGEPRSRTVTRYREILKRNPTDERLVFPAFADTLQNLCTGPLRNEPILRNNPPSEYLVVQVNKWIARKEAQYTAEASTAAPARAAGSPRRTRQPKSLSDFLTVEDKQSLIDRLTSIVADASPKQVATVIRALSDMGAIKVVTGQYSHLCEAMKMKHTPSDVVRYITGDRANSITQTDIETAKNNLTIP